MEKPKKIAISTSSFGQADRTAFDMLYAAGCEVIDNPHKRKLNEAEIIRHLKGVDGLLAGLEPLNENVFSKCHDLKAIARVGIGIDNVDLDAAKARDIKVSNTPDGPTAAVAEMTLCAALTLLRGLIPANTALHAKQWRKSIGRSPKDLNVLIIGYGRIGQSTARLFQLMGAKITVCDPLLNSGSLPEDVKIADLDEGLSTADIVSLHVSGNFQLLGEHEFLKLKKGALLLNSARGTLINEQALIRALDSDIVIGAWLDVFPEEPYSGPLTGYEQVLLTPHTSTYTEQCRRDMEIAAVNNLLRDLEICI